MMPDATNPVRLIGGEVRVTGDDGKILATFNGSDLRAWRQFQLDVFSNFDVVVTDSAMPVAISKTITGPESRNEKFVPSG
jgi:hypothetical protein